jgi:hypothetical protein
MLRDERSLKLMLWFPGERRVIQQMWSYITATLFYEYQTLNETLTMPSLPDYRAPGVARVRKELSQLLEPIMPVGGPFRNACEQRMDELIGRSTALSILLLGFSQRGEAELYWPDPKSLLWPRGKVEKRLRDDDYFLVRFPSVRMPSAIVATGIESPNLEPQWRGGLPPPKRDWIPVDMVQVHEPVLDYVSVGGRKYESLHYPAM